MRHRYMPWHVFTKPLQAEQWLQPFSDSELFGIDLRFKLLFGVGLLLLGAVFKGLSPWLLLPSVLCFVCLCDRGKGPLAFEKCAPKRLKLICAVVSPETQRQMEQLQDAQGFILNGQVVTITGQPLARLPQVAD